MPNTFDFLQPVLGDELFAQFSEKMSEAKGITLVNTADGSFVPKQKLEDERTVSKGYKTQIDELNGKLTQLQEVANGSEALKSQITQLQNDIQAKDNAMKQQCLEFKVKDAIRDKKAKNPDVVMKMIDLTKISENDGQFFGLNEQLDSLKKTDAYLFESEGDPNGGVDPHQDPDGDKPGSNYSVNEMIRRAAGR